MNLLTGLCSLAALGPVIRLTPPNIATFWFALPLVVAISFVYSASRHESWRKILTHSIRLSGMIFAILLVATVLLLIFNTQV